MMTNLLRVLLVFWGIGFWALVGMAENMWRLPPVNARNVFLTVLAGPFTFLVVRQ